MRIEISGQKQELKKEQAGRPHSGPPAEPGQDVLSDQRLNLKQQKGASEDRDGERKHGVGWKGEKDVGRLTCRRRD